jgi:hypothetical protein
MPDRKIFAGHAIRRLRRAAGLTQVALADALTISPSYLNLIERNQRPLSAAILLRLADRFDFDPRRLTEEAPGGGIEGLRRRLGDPLFADLEIDRNEMEEWLAAAPGGVAAFARLFDKLAEAGDVSEAGESQPVALVRREIERWRNHFADLDARAEALADELRLTSGDLYGAMAERLRAKHQLGIRILPADVMPDMLRRLDIHARHLQLSEMLSAPSRLFQTAYQLAQLEAREEIDALVAGAGLADRAADRLYRRHLYGYFAAALIMPYGRFLRACEGSGYDLTLLRRRFGASFEQVAHRLTTLQRVGARGLPFFMLRVDRAGQASKRYGGASAAPLVEASGRCPLWNVHAAFDRPAALLTQLVELEDGSRWFTLSRTVEGPARTSGGMVADFAVGIGVEAKLAATLAVARGVDLEHGATTAIGLGCAACTRTLCTQRAQPPRGRRLSFSERERGIAPFDFAGD